MEPVVATCFALLFGGAIWRFRVLSEQAARLDAQCSGARAQLERAKVEQAVLRDAMPGPVHHVTRGGVIRPDGKQPSGQTGSVPPHLDALMPADAADHAQALIEQVIATGEPAEFRFRARGAEGKRDWCARLVPCVDGQALLALADETELNQVRQELAATRARATEAARAKTKLLANMSHELRTPMNGVIGMTNLLLETPLSPEQGEYALIIQKSGELLLDLIADILDFAKLEAGKLTLDRFEFDLKQCVEEAISPLRAPLHTPAFEASTSFEGDLPSQVLGDSARLRQVLRLIVRSALARASASCAVRLRVTPAGHAASGTLLRFQLRCERKETQFTPSSRPYVEAATEELDLGLTLARRLIQLMGGEFANEGTPGPDGWSFTAAFQVKTDSDAPIDASALRRLAEVAQGDPSFVTEMIDLFLSNAPRNLEIMKSALAKGELAGMAAAAHSMKSSSAYLGALRFSKLCAEIEAQAKARESKDLPRDFELLLTEFERVKPALLAQRATPQ